MIVGKFSGGSQLRCGGWFVGIGCGVLGTCGAVTLFGSTVTVQVFENAETFPATSNDRTWYL